MIKPTLATCSFLVEKQQMYKYFWTLIGVAVSRAGHLFRWEAKTTLRQILFPRITHTEGGGGCSSEYGNGNPRDI